MKSELDFLYGEILDFETKKCSIDGWNAFRVTEKSRCEFQPGIDEVWRHLTVGLK